MRGEFGYWVFEGDTVPAQRPSWNYRKEDGGGIIIDMLCHWRYVLDNLFGEVKAVSCLGATHIPERVDEAGASLRLHGRRRGLRHVRARGRHCGPLQLVLVRTRAPGRPAHDAGGRHARIGRGRPARLLGPALRGDAAAGLEPGHRTADRLLRGLAEGPGAAGLRQRLQGAVGDCSCVMLCSTSPSAGTLLEGAKGVQLAEKGLESWQKRAWVDIPDLD